MAILGASELTYVEARERFLGWARAVGPGTEKVIGKVLDSRTQAPQAFEMCLGILNQRLRASEADAPRAPVRERAAGCPARPNTQSSSGLQ